MQIKRNYQKLFTILFVLIAPFALAGHVKAQTITAIAIEPIQPSINIGDQIQFEAVGTLSDGTTRVLSPFLSSPISGGYVHNCAVLPDGRVKCWGSNIWGQLGIGSPPPPDYYYSPVPVVEIDTAMRVTAGITHSCAVLSDGSIECWGENNRGQLGNNSTSNAYTPVFVVGITNAAEAAAGEHHSCALLSDGMVMCWGENSEGQLGNGTRTNSLIPVSVIGINTAMAVAAGYRHSCALLLDGTVRCWGFNNSGQLGTGTWVLRSLVPVAVSGINTAIAIDAAAYHTCALLSDGSARCWGEGILGVLGYGNTNNSNMPVSVSGIDNAVAIATGDLHGCALLSDETMKCWGYNYYGELGDGTTTDSYVPVAVNGISAATSIAIGCFHSCAVLSDGTAKCWGSGGQ
jgi:alpha-tubulin suppressor-like RCC1 family protein